MYHEGWGQERISASNAHTALFPATAALKPGQGRPWADREPGYPEGQPGLPFPLEGYTPGAGG